MSRRTPALRSFWTRLFLLVGLVAAFPGSMEAFAADYPNKPIRLVVAFPPGGGVDVAARVIGQALSQRLGQTVVVENLAGAGGNIGTEKVVKSPPDGYTMLFGSIALSINPSLYPKLAFDPVKDLAPVSLLSTSPYVLMVNPQVPIKSVRELIDAAKNDKDGNLKYATAG